MEPQSHALPDTQSLPTEAGFPRQPWNSVRWRLASKRCEHCGTEFHPWNKKLSNGRIRVMKEHLWKRQRFCSISCSKKHSNPMSQETNRRKVSRRLRQIGHRPHRQGGNGRPMPEPQKALLAILGPSWIPEFVVPTKMPRIEGWPTHYKIDIANCERRIAIEIDGHCHDSLARKKKDRRKTMLLAKRGWCVLRITNARAHQLSTTCTSPDTLLTSLMGFLSTTAT